MPVIRSSTQLTGPPEKLAPLTIRSASLHRTLTRVSDDESSLVNSYLVQIFLSRPATEREQLLIRNFSDVRSVTLGSFDIEASPHIDFDNLARALRRVSDVAHVSAVEAQEEVLDLTNRIRSLNGSLGV